MKTLSPFFHDIRDSWIILFGKKNFLRLRFLFILKFMFYIHSIKQQKNFLLEFYLKTNERAKTFVAC